MNASPELLQSLGRVIADLAEGHARLSQLLFWQGLAQILLGTAVVFQGLALRRLRIRTEDSVVWLTKRLAKIEARVEELDA